MISRFGGHIVTSDQLVNKPTGSIRADFYGQGLSCCRVGPATGAKSR
jgi:hypothetical protein